MGLQYMDTERLILKHMNDVKKAVSRYCRMVPANKSYMALRDE